MTYTSGTDLYRLLVESATDYAIFALDPTGHVVSWNPGAQRFKGYTAAEIIGRHFSIFYPPEDLARGKPAAELEIAARVGRLEDEGWRVRKDGTRFWANVVITALREADGTLVGFAKVTRDLTERRAAELKAIADAHHLAAEETLRLVAEARTREMSGLLDQLQRQATELECRRAEADAANRAKTDFLAAMSHELRTPLNAIAGYVELLILGLRGPMSADQTADLTRIQRSQQYLSSIVSDILDYSSLESGRIRYALRPVGVVTLFRDVSAVIAPQMKAKDIVFEPEACPTEIVALADPTKLQRILLNLLSNAAKFTPAGGRVRMRCARRGDRVLIDVADTGVGIAPDRQTLIFEPFVQLGRSFGNPGEGTGLGLAISRDLARGMGGDVTVASDGVHGSVFTVSLAAATGDATTDDRSPPAPPGRPSAP